jgi:hypothetical protein
MRLAKGLKKLLDRVDPKGYLGEIKGGIKGSGEIGIISEL